MNTRQAGGRRGNALVVGLMLGTLLGFSALSVDIGMIRVSVTQLQAAVDAAALSGAAELDGTDGGISRAVSRAQEIAALNPVLDQVLAVPSADIQIGTWDADSGTFTLYNAGDDPSTVNAVIVDHTPPQIGSALGQLAFGLAGYNIQARSTAMRPTGGKARSTKCFLPLAIPDCWLAGLPPGTNPPPFKFTFSPSPTDKIAWGDPDGNPNSNDIRDQLLGQCDHGAIEVGDPIYVNEGSHTSALQTIRDILNDVAPVDPDVWDTSVYGAQPLRLGTADTANTPVQSSVTAANWGHTLEGPVALVNAGTNCATVSFTGSKAMTGVAWAVIYDVKNSGSGKNIYVQLDVVNEHDIWGKTGGTLGSNVLGKGASQMVNF